MRAMIFEGPGIHTYPLEAANAAPTDLREGNFDGAAVLLMDQKP